MSLIVTDTGVPAYLSANSKASRAGLIVIQEWWGLNDQIKKTCDRFANLVGTQTIAVDLYRGKVATKADEAGHLMSELDWPKAVEDIKDCAEFLKKRGCVKIGVMGFCMGGALTIASAVRLPEGTLSAGSCFYGIPPAQLADPTKVKVSMQFHFGDKDHSKGFSSKADADALKAKLVAAGVDVSEFHQYPDGDHAFMNEDAPAYPFVPSAANAATERTVAFFKKTLF